MPIFQRTKRGLVARVAIGVAALGAVAALFPLLLLEDGEARKDPSRIGVQRTLSLTGASIVDGPQKATLRAEGETNLPDGCALSLAVLADARELASFKAHVQGGRFRLETPAAGQVVEGRYVLRATFSLEAQPEEIRKALNYQPGRLVAERALMLPPKVVAAAECKAELRALFDELLQGPPRDPAALDALDQRAQAMSQRLWIAGQKTAVHKLRLAMEEARRPQFRRQDFERLLLEAHVLAGL